MSNSRPATYEDAELIIKLYKLRREEKMRAAREWYLSKFNPTSIEDLNATVAPSNPENVYFRMVTSYWDMAASFVVHGVLHADLFLESGGEMLTVWAKIAEFIPVVREEYQAPTYLTNIEQVINNTPWALERVRSYRQRVARLREKLEQHKEE